VRVLDVVLIAVFLAWLFIKSFAGKSSPQTASTAVKQWPAAFDELDAYNQQLDWGGSSVGANALDYIPAGSLESPQDFQDWTNQWPSDIPVPLAPPRPN
jgi:hypothetical protein